MNGGQRTCPLEAPAGRVLQSSEQWPGEDRALEWADIDFDTRLIHAQRGADGPTKDDESRHVPLVPALADVLREWQKHCPVSSAVLPLQKRR